MTLSVSVFEASMQLVSTKTLLLNATIRGRLVLVSFESLSYD